MAIEAGRFYNRAVMASPAATVYPLLEHVRVALDWQTHDYVVRYGSYIDRLATLDDVRVYLSEHVAPDACILASLDICEYLALRKPVVEAPPGPKLQSPLNPHAKAFAWKHDFSPSSSIWT